MKSNTVSLKGRLADEFAAARRQGFTLIEVLVVIAITLILLGLLFAPLIKTFQFTHDAQLTAAAQDAARQTMEQVSRELQSAAAVRDTSQKQLNLVIGSVYEQSGGTWAFNNTVAHAYGAYLDIVPPRQEQGQIYDPSVDPANKTQSINAAGNVANPNVLLPIAPGTTVVRYFIGLKYPISPNFNPTTTGTEPSPEPYINSFEHLMGDPPLQEIGSTFDTSYSNSYTESTGVDNTYILYRVEFQPYNSNGTVNSNLFDNPYTDSNGNNAEPSASGAKQSNVPMIDDPDFFRVVTTSDYNPATGQNYTDDGSPTSQVWLHNVRVYNWYKIAKPVINSENIDLVFMPRTQQGQVQMTLVPNDGDAMVPSPNFDPSPTGGDQIPVIRTSVSFQAAMVSNDTLGATNSSNTAQGYGGDVFTGTNYIPTRYQANYGNWQGTPSIMIARVNAEGSAQTPNFYTALDTNATSQSHLFEFSSASTTEPVFDITSGNPCDASTPCDTTTGKNSTPPDYIPLTFDSGSGVVDCSVQAVPTSNDTGDLVPSNPLNPYWSIPPTLVSSNNQTNYLIDFSAAYPTGLSFNGTTYSSFSSPLIGTTMRMVVGSERVIGPDMSPGPSSTASAYQMVPYTRVPATASSQLRANQYAVNYATGVFIFASPPSSGGGGGSAEGPWGPPTGPTGSGTPGPLPVEISFSYQNNLFVDTGATPNVTTPAVIRASYQTGALINVSLGVRIYNPANNLPATFTLTNKIRVGNAGQ